MAGLSGGLSLWRPDLPWLPRAAVGSAVQEPTDERCLADGDVRHGLVAGRPDDPVNVGCADVAQSPRSHRPCKKSLPSPRRQALAGSP